MIKYITITVPNENKWKNTLNKINNKGETQSIRATVALAINNFNFERQVKSTNNWYKVRS